jgi:hypothetical protein
MTQESINTEVARDLFRDKDLTENKNLLPKQMNEFYRAKNDSNIWQLFKGYEGRVMWGAPFTEDIEYCYIDSDACVDFQINDLQFESFQFNLITYGLIFCNVHGNVSKRTIFCNLFNRNYEKYGAFNTIYIDETYFPEWEIKEFIVERIAGSHGWKTWSLYHVVPYSIFFHYPNRRESLDLILRDCRIRLVHDDYLRMDDKRLLKYLESRFEKLIYQSTKN